MSHLRTSVRPDNQLAMVRGAINEPASLAAINNSILRITETLSYYEGTKYCSLPCSFRRFLVFQFLRTFVSETPKLAKLLSAIIRLSIQRSFRRFLVLQLLLKISNLRGQHNEAAKLLPVLSQCCLNHRICVQVSRECIRTNMYAI